MANTFSSGKNSIAMCDRCGFQVPLKELRPLVIKTKEVNLRVCKSCWEPDQPQLQLGMYPVFDPQAVRNPRKDTSYYGGAPTGDGGSRDTQWGWLPVGGGASITNAPNALAITCFVGTVTAGI